MKRGRTHVKGEKGRNVTRTDLRQAVYDCCPGLSRAEAGEIFDMVFEEIAAALAQGEPVRLHSFGSFKVRSKRGRVGRNPKTGEPLAKLPQLDEPSAFLASVERSC
jgi:integration host factor subunit alpha